jgi:hypothetical protein
MVMATLDEVVEMIKKHQLAREEEIVGCSEVEIAALEGHFGRRFPGEYRAFLKRMGKKAGRCFIGTRTFADQILLAQSEFREYVAEVPWGRFLPDGVWVVYSLQGYAFGFICARFGDDAPVFTTSDSDPTVNIFDWTFTGFVDQLIRESLGLGPPS